MSSAVSLGRDKSIIYSRISVIVLLYSLYIAYNNLYISYLDKGIGLYNGLFHISTVTLGFTIFLFFISLFILLLTSFYPRKIWLLDYSNIVYINKFVNNILNLNIYNVKYEQYKILEYSLIILFIISGGVFLISSSDLVSIFLSIELQSYGLYLLTTIFRNSEKSTSAGLTYFLLGGMSSCFILLGISILYVNTGITNLDSLYVIMNLFNENSYYINIGLLIMSIGFLFKIAAAPFHFWSPDVYDSVPTVVTAFVAIIPKISILIFFVELVKNTSGLIDVSWTYCFIISSLFSLIIGSILGLKQSRIKRLLAYSSISHVGFILLSLSINSIESIKAFFFYLLQYAISNLNMFLILIGIGFSLFFYINEQQDDYNKLTDKENSPIQLITQLNGFYKVNPLLALSLGITIFSFVGIPPLVGFFAKQMVLSSSLDNGYVFMSIIAILTSVIGAVYYLYLVKQIFFERCMYILNPLFIEKKINVNSFIKINVKDVSLSTYLSISISIFTLIILLFMFVSEEFLIVCDILSLSMFS
jgi:NADH-ubiquinone oxidoreductase chain 2